MRSNDTGGVAFPGLTTDVGVRFKSVLLSLPFRLDFVRDVIRLLLQGPDKAVGNGRSLIAEVAFGGV